MRRLLTERSEEGLQYVHESQPAGRGLPYEKTLLFCVGCGGVVEGGEFKAEEHSTRQRERNNSNHQQHSLQTHNDRNKLVSQSHATANANTKHTRMTTQHVHRGSIAHKT